MNEVLKTKPLGLLFLSRATQVTFPDLVEAFLSEFVKCSVYSDDCVRSLANELDPTLFERPTLAKAWFCAGGGFFEDHFPNSWKDREDVFLWIAKHRVMGVLVEFKKASRRLKGNLEFMIQATEYYPDVFVGAERDQE